jgi:hypothetical protein
MMDSRVSKKEAVISAARLSAIRLWRTVSWGQLDVKRGEVAVAGA